MTALRLGTRASLLATTQSGLVANMLREATGRDVELVHITTHGDVATGSLASLGGTGVFAAALREALLRDECDLVVHSLKDLPTAGHPGLALGAIPARERQNDVLCVPGGGGLDALPQGARVGTGSPRRVAQLLRRRPDLEVTDIRGNIDTRLRKATDGEYDAIVLAEAGLRRINRDEVISEVFDLDVWPTSAGQGALAVEVREDALDTDFGAVVASISDQTAWIGALWERAVLAGLEAGCAAPVGISVTAAGDELNLVAEVYAPDGSEFVRVETSAAEALLSDEPARADAAASVVDQLLAQGAAALAGLPGNRR